MSIRIRLLGHASIEPASGPPLAVRNGELYILALLVLRAGSVVPNADLERFWQGRPSKTTQVQKHIGYLRMKLGKAGCGKIVTVTKQGYRLQIDETAVDLLVFLRSLLDAAEARRSREHDVERAHLYDALRQWQGPRFGGTVEPLIAALGAEPERHRREAVIRLAELEHGEPDELLSHLRATFTADPADGRVCLWLMLTLYRTGHGTPEALRHYETHSDALAGLYGKDPDGPLTELKWAIARDDREAVDRAHGARRHDAAAAPPRQLPPNPAEFVGRQDLVDHAKWLLTPQAPQTPPIVVITGSAGTGKTALARRVAHLLRSRFPDGHLHLELGGTGPQPLPAAEAMARVLRAFNVPKVPHAYDERLALYRTTLGDQRVLLFLDDAADEAQVRDLIPGSPNSAVLITARCRLPGVAGAEHLPELGPLPLDDAQRLFDRIVRRCEPQAPAESDAVALIAELCGGLPLAVVIAAMIRSGHPGVTTAEVAELISAQRIDALTWQDQSVAACIDAGSKRLTERARQVFAGLGLLELAEFDGWTADAVLGADAGTALDELARIGLLTTVGAGRYRFHELTRLAARNKAEQRFDEPARRAVMERVYGTLTVLARSAHRGIYGGNFEIVHPEMSLPHVPAGLLQAAQAAPASWFETERANLDRAVRHAATLGMTGIAWDLSITAHEFCNIHGCLADWVPTHQVALRAAATAGDRRGEAAMLSVLGQPAVLDTRRDGVSDITALRRSVTLFRELADPHGLAFALRTLGNNLRRAGDFAAALEAFTEARTGYEAAGDEVGRWQVERYIGQCHLDLGDPDTALRYLTDAADRAGQIGEARLRAQSAYWLGCAELARGRRGRADEHFRYVEEEAAGSGDLIGRARAQLGRADVARLDGDPVGALDLLQRALHLARRGAGDAVLEGRIHLSLADVAPRRTDRAEHLRAAADCFSTGHAAHLHDRAVAALASLGSS
ncbi:BTAD domain-containing putative transcriptional regulator [Dactylosporangium sp. NPDC050688]|uniref:BTAD domain-containing putative transcriptional regulator n=1 Tax=Dactylosporangium sp. NPDC050688 TaxID=3157217 RepID=UPI0033E4685A